MMLLLLLLRRFPSEKALMIITDKWMYIVFKMVFMQKKDESCVDQKKMMKREGVVVVDAWLSGFGMRGVAATRRRAAVLLVCSFCLYALERSQWLPQRSSVRKRCHLYSCIFLLRSPNPALQSWVKSARCSLEM